jgi:serine phosphatase RsbU (regulator of sigma subunit)
MTTEGLPRRISPRFEGAGVSYALSVVGVATLYVLLAQVGFRLAFSVPQASAVWPPTGVAVAALLLGGYRFWPAIFLGSFLANVLTHEPPAIAAAIGAGNTLGPLLGVFLLRSFADFDLALQRVRDVIALAVLGGVLGMSVNASLGALSLAIAGLLPWSHFWIVWRIWWAGDTIGVLLVAPLALTWTARSRPALEPRRWLELLGLAIATSAMAFVGFGYKLTIGFVVYPPIIWSGLRFSQPITSVAVALISAIAIIETKEGLGPFRRGPIDDRLVGLVVFIAVLAVTGLVLGAATAERERAEEERRAIEQRELAHATRIAETLQVAFLPKRLPVHRDLSFDALYLAGEHEALLGGDWYDAFAVADGRIVVSIGDMLGHGIDAAVKAVELRQRIFATAFSESDPAQILSKVNGMFDSDDAIATALVAFIDPTSATLHYASAGHPPPMVASRSIAPRVLPYGGLPLGVAPALVLQTHIVQLERDALILFYTDGLTEFARDLERAEAALLEGLGALVREPDAPNPAKTLLRRVMGSAQPADDAVIMLLRLSPAVRAEAVSDGEALRKDSLSAD